MCSPAFRIQNLLQQTARSSPPALGDAVSVPEAYFTVYVPHVGTLLYL